MRGAVGPRGSVKKMAEVLTAQSTEVTWVMVVSVDPLQADALPQRVQQKFSRRGWRHRRRGEACTEGTAKATCCGPKIEKKSKKIYQ